MVRVWGRERPKRSSPGPRAETMEGSEVGDGNHSADANEGDADRVRRSTSAEFDARLDHETRERVEAYAARGGA